MSILLKPQNQGSAAARMCFSFLEYARLVLSTTDIEFVEIKANRVAYEAVSLIGWLELIIADKGPMPSPAQKLIESVNSLKRSSL